ncbi:Rieske (2Fe-2S) protein [Streptomyces cellulosae]|jgi:ubiquinol-cytochrome c reductase iron-sulfur subunit|uniref:Cytochrome bc1 complex Rieske iron-sulfur subunit n=2 Tax=Streptomyces TaxID=1883 RepID=A0ABU3J8L8_9ACTN|nr:Rieske (2Fe-2S) protein [Streptomyces sp. McG7]MBT2906545.1 Rieske (2Fe-2S) protein [Streptomyces sp. McG8]MCX4476601.1 Rieske (2Fe-2S) protein [Streptomyces cellulosae]MDQ0488607.1 ubiquinol-cytochrome c reductase iron-sulfur subunit [Streptomyces thermodiastaticus]MDT6971400.1 Rieske 2Fe-2S domain-containing protein [Streptomyces thermocarboxydus]MDX3415980.1 Rieske 2Fe-2S domain-containing protein [Streptomyces sp. MD20-1-1]MYQ29629.1 Rieske 2Fe-2S domain-containing protein [Streptomyce
MSSQDIPEENLPAAQDTSQGAVKLADEQNPFADPGLPPHEPRVQDIDERAAKRSERVVALLFTVSMLATVGFIASYVTIPVDKSVFIWPIGHISALNFALGMTLGLALFCIGAGAVHWARTLMSDHELADERHPIEAAPETRAKVMDDFRQGAKESALGRRKLIRNTMFGALALFPLSGVVLLRDLGPLPGTKLRHTLWSKGKLLVNMNTNEPLRPSDLVVGSLTFAKPEGLEEHDHEFQTEIAKAALMLVRIQPDDIKDKRSLEWSHEGILAYSKICTHVGCPISLYEQQTHHALCPCHQSTFDLSDGAKVIFGPAGHPLPQLRIGVNDEGYLEALGDFDEPVGPAFWERG